MRYEVSKRGQAKSGPTLSKPKSESQRLTQLMNTSNLIVFSASKSYLCASSGLPQTRPCMSLVYIHINNIIGSSLSEPHINGTNVREIILPERAPHKRHSCARIVLYIYILLLLLWYVRHARGAIICSAHQCAKHFRGRMSKLCDFHMYTLIGVSLSEPHINSMNVRNMCISIYLHIYVCVSYVRH